MTEDAFIKLLEIALRKAVPSSLVLGKVASVDKEKRTCAIERDGQPELFDVRLNAIIDKTESHCTVFPKEGSFVIAGLMGGTYVVLTTSEVESLVGKVGEQSFVFDTDGWAFNDGKLGGMVKIEDLVKKLNAVEKDINDLKSALGGWVPVPKDGGAALKSRVASWAGQRIIETKKADLENEKIKH